MRNKKRADLEHEQYVCSGVGNRSGGDEKVVVLGSKRGKQIDRDCRNDDPDGKSRDIAEERERG